MGREGGREGGKGVCVSSCLLGLENDDQVDVGLGGRDGGMEGGEGGMYVWKEGREGGRDGWMNEGVSVLHPRFILLCELTAL